MAVETTTIRVVADTRDAERALGRLNTALGALVTGAAITSFARFADATTNLQNKLALVTQEGQTASDMFGIIARSAINLGAPLKDVGDLFFRVANNTKDLSLTQREQVQITETLIKGFQLSGATAGEVAGGVIQLGQAFAVGTLRGDELNSVLESLPMVAEALAKQFGVQTGALKALGEQGRISSRQLADAILSSGQAIDTAFGNKIPTISQSFNTLQTALSVSFQQFDQGTGISQALSLALLKIANALVTVIDFFEKYGKIILFVTGLIAALLIPVRIALIVFSSFGKVTTFLIEPFIKLAKVLYESGNALKVFLAGFTFAGIGKIIIDLTGAIAGLFSKDKVEAANKYQTELDKLNKKLGLDNARASEQARKASEALTAQQLKDADAIRKANIDRTIALNTIVRDQTASLSLSKLESSELQVQEALNNINKQLIKEIKNDKGEVIASTKGLSAEEEKIVRALIEQNIQNQIIRDINREILQVSLEQNRLDIRSLDLREEQAAVDAKRLQFGSNFTAEMEKQTRELVRQQQGLRESIALEQQRALLSGQATPQSRSQQIETATGVIGRLDPRLAAEQQYQTEMAAIKNSEILSEVEKNAYLLRLQQEHQAKMHELAKQRAEADLKLAGVTNRGILETVSKSQDNIRLMQQGGIQGVMGGIEQLSMIFGQLGTYNKQAFEMAKRFNIANAIMNTYLGATKALSMYPPPFNFIAMAAVVASGLAQVAAIRSQSYSGRQLGGPVMGGQTYMVGENGPELFTPNTTGSITRNQDLQMGNNVTVNFNIVANDTAGFDQLLASRRGLITQIINDAVLEKGRRSIA